MGFLKKSVSDSGLPKAACKPAMKNISAKGIAGKSGSIAGGEPKSPGTIKGFTKGGTVKP